MRKLFLRLILGRNSQYFDVVKMRGQLYKVDIYPYESTEDLMERATNNGVFVAHKSTE